MMIHDEPEWSLVLVLKRSLSSSAVTRALLLPAIHLSAPMTPLCSPILLLSNLPKSTMYSLPIFLYLFRQTDQASTVSVSLYQVFQSPHKFLIVLTKSVTEARIKCKLKWTERRWIMLLTINPANLKVVDFTREEVDELQSIDKTNHFRVCNPSWTGWGSLGFPDCLDSDQWGSESREWDGTFIHF